MIREGTLVLMVAGPWVGRFGLVEAADPMGLAVRLRTATIGGERDVVVVAPQDARPVDLRERALAS